MSIRFERANSEIQRCLSDIIQNKMNDPRLNSLLYISEVNINHIIRTLRSFLEGFSLLVNNNSFGNPVSFKESFDLSIEIIMNGIKSLEREK